MPDSTPVEEDISQETAQSRDVPPVLQKIDKAGKAFRSFVKAEEDGKNPEMTEDVELGKKIDEAQWKVSKVVDKFYREGDNASQVSMDSLENSLFDKPDQENPLQVAKVTTYTVENSGPRRSPQKVNKAINKYPTILKEELVAAAIVTGMEGQVLGQGPMELSKTNEGEEVSAGDVLNRLLQENAAIPEGKEQKLEHWSGFIDGHKLVGKADEKSQEKIRSGQEGSLSAGEVAGMLSRLDEGDVSRAERTIKLISSRSISPKEVGTVLAKVASQKDGEENGDWARSAALGAAKALMPEKPKASAGVLIALARITGESPYDIIEGDTAYAKNYKDVLRDAQRYGQKPMLSRENVRVLREQDAKKEAEQEAVAAREAEKARKAEEKLQQELEKSKKGLPADGGGTKAGGPTVEGEVEEVAEEPEESSQKQTTKPRQSILGRLRSRFKPK